MSTMILSLPKTLKCFVAEQVAEHGYESGSEYIRELIRHDIERQKLRRLLNESGCSPAVLAAHFSGEYLRLK